MDVQQRGHLVIGQGYYWSSNLIPSQFILKQLPLKSVCFKLNFQLKYNLGNTKLNPESANIGVTGGDGAHREQGQWKYFMIIF